MEKKPVVVVAMSGGVDSSVTAALLVEQGYEVIGMMLKLWSEQGSEPANRCCTPASIAQARRVAAILSIPFYVVDAKQLFYDTVVRAFIDDYTHNLTPNPCITCNRSVRWGFLYQQALTVGADYLSTGHYARIASRSNGSYQLLRGVDPAKDQSYVLHVLTQEHLSHTLFPLGAFSKPEVRQMARQFNLPVAKKPDSQDLCFIGGDGDYRKFLARHAPGSQTPGSIIDSEGNILGQHLGLASYTIGQRKGIDVSSPTPLYVLAKDSTQNVLIVGRHEQTTTQHLIAKNANWIDGSPPSQQFSAQVRVRYKAQEIPCDVTILDDDAFQVALASPVRDITPGQAAVLYNGDVCLGGGIITPAHQ